MSSWWNFGKHPSLLSEFTASSPLCSSLAEDCNDMKSFKFHNLLRFSLFCKMSPSSSNCQTVFWLSSIKPSKVKAAFRGSITIILLLLMVKMQGHRNKCLCGMQRKERQRNDVFAAWKMKVKKKMKKTGR